MSSFEELEARATKAEKEIENFKKILLTIESGGLFPLSPSNTLNLKSLCSSYSLPSQLSADQKHMQESQSVLLEEVDSDLLIPFISPSYSITGQLRQLRITLGREKIEADLCSEENKKVIDFPFPFRRL